MDKPVYSLVIPIFDEEEALDELRKRLQSLMDLLDGPSEVILIDDGSRDRSYEIMVDMSRQDPRFRVAQLSRNFGHQTAITAGMDLASGDAIVIMDADLQDPPEVVLEMAARWREGFEVIYGVRDERLGESWFKKVTAALFYRFLRRVTDLDIPADVGDFRLVDRRALDAFKSLRERSRYIRGLFTWIGFKQVGVRYQRAERFAGTTKYPLHKMLKLATDGIVTFSVAPLRLALNCGFAIAALSLLAAVTAITLKLKGIHVVPGWVSLVVVTAFLGGVQLIVLGTLGEYVGRIYEEVRRRPLYIIRETQGIEPDLVPKCGGMGDR
jgi:glycosyltransferase involved in cell wall biosynthesis